MIDLGFDATTIIECTPRSMEEDEEDDIYAPDETGLPVQFAGPIDTQSAINGAHESGKVAADAEDEEEAMDEEESDSDIDIITEKKDDGLKDKPSSFRASNTKVQLSKRSPSAEPLLAASSAPAAVKIEAGSRENARLGSSYPPVKTSTVDVDTKPTHEPTGKNIMDVDMDHDFGEDEQPWRRPGSDMTDYFNYGFDEFTWSNYCLKQGSVRAEVADSKKQLDDMQNFMSTGMPGMPSMPGVATVAPGMPVMPGMGDIPPEMQQMFTQMMSQGMDPTQMDPATFMQIMSGGQGGQADPNHGFGGQGYAQQGHNSQQMGYGYGNGGGGRGRGRRW